MQKKSNSKSTGVVVAAVKALSSPAQASVKRGCCAVRKRELGSEESGTLLGTRVSRAGRNAGREENKAAGGSTSCET